MTARAGLLLMATIVAPLPAQLEAQAVPVTTHPPKVDRLAVGWLLGGGGNDGAASDGVLETSLFGDLPVRGGRLRVSADLGRWGFTSIPPGGPALLPPPGPPFHDTAEVRRVTVQSQRRLAMTPGEVYALYYGGGLAYEFWRFDTSRPDRKTGLGFLGAAGLEYLKPGGRLGVLGEARLSVSLGPTVDGSGAINLTVLAGVKWRLTAP
jgi:hypothetical protein